MKSIKKTKSRGGILSILLIIVAIVLILGYFNIKIQDVVEKPASQSNLAYLGQKATEMFGNLWANIKAKVSPNATSTLQ